MNLNKHQPILITGGGGYIGTHVAEQFLKKGYKVRIFDQFVFGKNVIDDLLRDKNLSIVVGDIDDTEKLISAFKNVGSVIHLAGIVGDPASLVDKDFTIHTNITLTKKIKDLSKKFNIERFIFASSCSVYGASEGLVNEESKLNPVSLYAQTKIDSEKEMLEDKSKNFHPIILRFATVFGHSRRPRFDLVANLFVAQAYHTGKITVSGADQYRPLIHASDVARAIVLMQELPLENVERQIFNVGDNNFNVTIGDLAKLVKDIVKTDKNGNTVKVIIKKDLSDKRNYKVSFNKINSLGFKASVSLEDGLKEIHNNFKKKIYKDNFNDPFYINAEMAKLISIK